MKFGRFYRERLRLADGTDVLLRWVKATDKPYFATGIATYSQESLYRRFLRSKGSFSESELRYLTEVDGENHLCLVAMVRENHEGVGIAVTQAIRVEDEPDAAEFGLFVGDRFQRLGLGRAMLLRLALAARERGYEFLVGEMFADNDAMFAVIDGLPLHAEWNLSGGIATMRLDLASLRVD